MKYCDKSTDWISLKTITTPYLKYIQKDAQVLVHGMHQKFKVVLDVKYSFSITIF